MRLVALAGAAAAAVTILGVVTPAMAATATHHSGGGGSSSGGGSGSSGGSAPLSATVSPASLDFGPVEIGTSETQTLTVTNTGTTQEVIGVLDIEDPPGTDDTGGAGEFLVQPEVGQAARCWDAVLAPGGTCIVTVTFTPWAVGPQPVVLSVFADASGTQEYEPVATASLTGEGTTLGAVVGSITLPADVAADGVTGGQSVTATVNLSTTYGGPCATFSQPITVDLIGSTPTASFPSQIVVPAGQCSASFTITTTPVTAAQFVAVGASATDDPNFAFFSQIDAAVGFTVNP